MAFLALFLRESSKQTCLQPDSGVYSIETSCWRPGYEADRLQLRAGPRRRYVIVRAGIDPLRTT